MAEASLFEKRFRFTAKANKWAYKVGHDGLVINHLVNNGKVFRTLDIIDKTIDERLIEVGILHNQEGYFTFDKIRGYGYESYLTK